MESIEDKSKEQEKEPIDCNKQGRRCVYRAGKHEPNLCDYCLITGHSRGGSPHRCTKYEWGKRRSRIKYPSAPSKRRTRRKYEG